MRAIEASFEDELDDAGRRCVKTVVNLDSDSRTCPACLTTYPAGPIKCPSCGLYIGG